MSITLQTLKSCRADRHAISSLQEQIELLRSAMEMANTVLTSTPKGRSAEQDKMAANVARLHEMANELVDKLVSYFDKVGEIEAWLEELPEGDRSVIRLRYIDGLDWRKVAARTHYALNYCFKINSRVLQRGQ